MINNLIAQNQWIMHINYLNIQNIRQSYSKKNEYYLIYTPGYLHVMIQQVLFGQTLNIG